jgi:hypothetical protein
MKKRRIIFAGAACVLVAILVVSLRSWVKEPRYKGASLTGWLCVYHSQANPSAKTDWQQASQARGAIESIGTNAVPFLLRWLAYEPASWRGKWKLTCAKLPNPLDRLGRMGDMTFGLRWDLRNDLALDGFKILGAKAEAAVPELTRWMCYSSSTNLTKRATLALASIGEPGFLALVGVITNQALLITTRGDALFALGRLHSPVAGTADPARMSVPALLGIVNGPYSPLRETARDALQSIAPEVFESNRLSKVNPTLDFDYRMSLDRPKQGVKFK